MTSSSEMVADILVESARKSISGDLSPDERVSLYSLALNVAVEEIYRLNELLGGAISPVPMLLIQQLTMIADPENPASASELISGAEALKEVMDASTQAHSGGSEPTPEEVRGPELGSSEDNT